MARTVLRIYPPIDARFDDVALQQRVLSFLRDAHPDYDYEIVMEGKHRADDCFTSPWSLIVDGGMVRLSDWAISSTSRRSPSTWLGNSRLPGQEVSTDGWREFP